jgi:hypothetical protein
VRPWPLVEPPVQAMPSPVAPPVTLRPALAPPPLTRRPTAAALWTEKPSPAPVLVRVRAGEALAVVMVMGPALVPSMSRPPGAPATALGTAPAGTGPPPSCTALAVSGPTWISSNLKCLPVASARTRTTPSAVKAALGRSRR